MTMQVGMVGTDGIVLASDLLWQNSGESVRHPKMPSKIRFNHEKGVAIACAGSMDTAWRVANDLMRDMSAKSWGYPRFAATEIAARVIKKCDKEKRRFQCLMLISRPSWQLWSLHYGQWKMQTEPQCEKETRICFAGDSINPAVFWGDRYCRLFPLRPIRELVPLASHLIVQAHNLNSGGIQGLEIVTCDTAGVHRLSDDYINELTAKANEWDAQIGELILGYPKQLAYAENVVS